MDYSSELLNLTALLPLIAGFQIQIPPQAATQITSARKWLIKAENLYGADNQMTVPFLYELVARTVRYGSNGFRTALPLYLRQNGAEIELNI